jgi:integrase
MADFVSNRSSKSIEKNRRTGPDSANSRGMDWSLHDRRGRRKYLVPAERAAFLQAALQAGGITGSFCAVLTLSGARISEVLALTPENIDDANGAINFETLKRRKKGIIRAVPVPRNLLFYLDGVHRYSEALHDPAKIDKRLWTWSRTTAWRRVHRIMRLAGNPEHLSSPKALRHAFGAEAALNKIPLTLIKRWMGHAQLETTEIYTSLVGEEERLLARLTWSRASKKFRH